MQRSLSSSLEPSPSPPSPPPQVEPWTPEGGAAPDLTAQNRLTRQAGGGGGSGSGTVGGITGGSSGGAPGGGAVLPRRLVVDMREFMSGLPAVLHGRGLQLSPLTLEVSQGAVVFRQDLQPALIPPSPP